jgi:heme-degrading monooxygenase HmoA
MPTTELTLPVARESTFIVVWEFQVKAECEADFVAAYGPDGEWARLLGRSPEFLGVELLCSVDDTSKFFTLDHWSSAAGLQAFQAANATAYDVLDRRCGNLTVWERRIGGFPSEA